MAVTLTLYKKAFNFGEQVHLVFSNRQKYIDFLNDYKILELPMNSWRINKGQILVSKEAFKTANQDYRMACYASVKGEGNNDCDFYFVTSKVEQSGFVIFNVEKDLWGTNYPYASITEMRISRCNRNIGNGYFDDIKEVDGNEHYRTLKILDPLYNYDVVFLASIVMKKEWFGTNPLTQTFLFAIPLTDVYRKETNSTWANLDPVDKVRYLIGGLYSAQGATTDTSISVLKCWIVPRDLISLSSTKITRLNGSSFVTPTNYNFDNVAMAKPIQGYMTFDIANFIGDAPEWYYDYKLAFGPWGNEMTLTHFTNDTKVYVRSFIECADVRIELVQGSNVKDISSSFELNLNVNNQVGTSTQDIQKAVAKISAIIASGAVGYSKGGIVGAAVGVGTSAIALRENPQANSPASTNGDGAMTFYGGNANGVTYPWVLKGYKSLSDEMENAYFNGANFDIRDNNLRWVEVQAHLGANSYNEDSTFIQLSSLDVANVDRQTGDYIENEFKRGIKYKTLLF